MVVGATRTVVADLEGSVPDAHEGDRGGQDSHAG